MFSVSFTAKTAMPDPRAEDLFGLSDHAGDSDAASLSADDQGESRTAGSSRSSKRRKVTHFPSSVDEDESDVSTSEDGNASPASGPDNSGDSESEEDEEDTANEKEKKKKKKKKNKMKQLDPTILTNPTSLQPLTPDQLALSRLATKASGVCYLSRLPPFMRPHKVKSLLSRFGPVNRIFLSPESPVSHTRRVKFGGNKKMLYDEGWVEFADKKVAKLVAETLNATTVGGKKGSYYHDDVWNIKYLPKFKWYHLTAQIAHENAARQSRLRVEIAQAHRENKTFTRNVERAKMIENMQESRKRKALQSVGGAGSVGGGGVTPSAAGGEVVEVRRQFRQNKIKGVKAAKEEGVKSSEGVKKAMGKLF